MKLKPTVAAILVFSIFQKNSQAQFYKNMSVGFNIGTFIYQGDLTPSNYGSLKTSTLGFSFFAKKPINDIFAVRLNVSIAQLKGDESKYSNPAFRQLRNFKFSTPVKEFSAQILWNILGKNNNDFGISPYVFTGTSFTLLNVKKDYSQMNNTIFHSSSTVVAGLAIDDAHGTPKKISSVPIGIGAQYPINDRLSVNAESAYRFVFTDYLDGFSASANSKKQDHFYSLMAGLVYKFGVKNKGIACPKMKFY